MKNKKNKIEVFCFTLHIWSIQSQVFGHPCNGRYVFHLMKWVLSQIRYWWVTPTKAYLASRRILYIKGFIMNWFGVYISLWQHTEYLPVPKSLAVGGPAQFHRFSELYRFCLQQQGLAVSLWRADQTLDNSLGCLQVHVEHLYPRTHLYINYNWYQKLHLVTRDVQLKLCLPYYQEILFGLPSYIFLNIYQEFSTSFHTTPQMGFKFRCLSLLSPLLSHTYLLPSIQK